MHINKLLTVNSFLLVFPCFAWEARFWLINYNLEIEQTIWRKNNIWRRLFREAREASTWKARIVSDFSHIQSLDQQEEVDVADGGVRHYTLGNYSTFTEMLNFNSISRLVVNTTNMEMKHALIHLIQNNEFQKDQPGGITIYEVRVLKWVICQEARVELAY